jgi:hypothetical protein
MTDLNPFNYGDPVPPEELINRDAELEQLLRLAEGGHNSRLQAPRRYGKTSVLLKVLAEADKAGYRTVNVDFLTVTTPQEVARRIEEAYRASLTGQVRQLVARLGRSWRGRAKVAPGGVGGELEYMGAADPMQRLSDLLDLPKKILEKTGQRTLVVFDEFQDFLRAEGSLVGLLRSKIQLHGDAAGYIFCGSEQAFLEEQFTDRKKPLFDQARPLYLQPLSDADLGDYIADRFERTRRDAGDALDLLLDLVRGHPQRAILIAHHLWEQTPRGAEADPDTFDVALKAVDRETQERFESTWQNYADRPNLRRVLKAMALSPETLYNQRTLAAFSLNKGQAAAGERGLDRAGEVQDVDGRPQIIDPLFERWVRLTAQPEEPDFPSLNESA